MLAALALMAFAMTAAALAITVATAAFVLALATAALVLTAFVLLAIALAVVAVATATTATGAAHLLSHGSSYLLIRGGATLLDGNAEVLVHNSQHIIQLLTSLQEALADGVVNHVLTQTIEGGDFLLRRGHALHVLVAELLTVFVHLAEQVGGLGVLIEKTNTGFGRYHLLALGKSIGQLGGDFH